MQHKAIYKKNKETLMRAYLDKLLTRSYIEQAKLSRFERILFTSYGTLTAILEAYLYEPIQSGD